jgi:LmbE family N-acetylglucosaminyl deacetylase
MAERDGGVVGEMRDWGLVTAGELERIVVVSPHLDDAVLGCGRLLAAHPGATVVTVYAGAPPAYPDPMTHWDTISGFTAGDDVLAARRQEDRLALAELGATPVWLDFVEHQYLDRPDWVGADQTVDALEAAIRAARPTAVLAPFGIANPDHTATHEAARAVRERIPEPAWFCYEDMGYKHIPGLLAWRVSQLFRAGTWPTPAAPTVDHGDAAKQRALAHYGSQLRALEADWQIGEKLAAPAPEQLWRLAPPPPGWERLTRDG